MESVRSHDGTTIAFDRWGAGPARILAGAAFQHRAIDPRTAHLADRLAPHYTVVHDDHRGRGDSGDTPPYAVTREAAPPCAAAQRRALDRRVWPRTRPSVHCITY